MVSQIGVDKRTIKQRRFPFLFVFFFKLINGQAMGCITDVKPQFSKRAVNMSKNTLLKPQGQKAETRGLIGKCQTGGKKASFKKNPTGVYCLHGLYQIRNTVLIGIKVEF